MKLCQQVPRVTVLRNGKVVGTIKTSDTSEADLAKMMVGRPVIHQVNKVGGVKSARENADYTRDKSSFRTQQF